jgi:homocysteine S-methyltransferase
MTGFVTALREGVLVCDGAMGTMLHAAGNSLDRALPELNLTNAELVSTVHESYLAAGVDIIQTNTFGASALRLAEHGSAGPVREINLAGVRIACEAQDKAGRRAFVAGSVSPAVTARQRPQVTPAQRIAALREQVSALAEGGVDVLILETFGYLDELTEAVTAAAELTGAPIIAQATFTSDGRTLGGETPREVASTLSSLPVVALGTNCTLGPQHTLTVVTELIRHTSLPVSAQPNAGLPRRAAGRRFEYPVDGGYFARYARRYAEAGASLIGGCCVTTPTQLKAAVAAIAAQRWPRPGRGAPAVALADRPAAAPAEQGDLAERLAAGRFVVAAEIAPPVGRAGDEAIDAVAALRDRGLGTFLVSPQQTARAHLSALNLTLHLRQRLGADAIATITTWDKTIMALQADLLGAHALGLRDVVCATGNPPLRDDYPSVDGIWEVDSVGLARPEPGPGQQRPDPGDQDLVPHRGAVQPRRAGRRGRGGAHQGQAARGRPVPDHPPGLRTGLLPADGGRTRRGRPRAAGAGPAARFRRGRVPRPRGSGGHHSGGDAAHPGAGRRRRCRRRPGPGGQPRGRGCHAGAGRGPAVRRRPRRLGPAVRGAFLPAFVLGNKPPRAKIVPTLGAWCWCRVAHSKK